MTSPQKVSNSNHERGLITTNIRAMKPEIRVLGVDDGVFKPHSRKMVDVVGVVYRGGYWLDGFMHTRVHVDGIDATKKLISMIISSRHYSQIRATMLNGVTLAGFNVVNIPELFEAVKMPIIAVVRNVPNFVDIRKALTNLHQPEKRWKSIEMAGKMISAHTRKSEAPIYAHIAGITEEDAKRLLRITSTRSNIPEPLRVAHIIASGLTKRRL